MATYKRKTPRKKSGGKTKISKTKIHLVIYSALIIFFLFFHYRVGIKVFVNSIYEWVFTENKEEKLSVHDIRNVEVLSKHEGMLFGFDVSHYQDDVKWNIIDSIYQKYSLDFVFLRATMGIEGVDAKFSYNWSKAKSRLLIRGAYHYYRPDENSILQAENFIANVKLDPGDFVPVLDIEELPKKQSMDSLKSGLKKWLHIVETHYKVKPIIYSGEDYYHQHLERDFSEYPFWIANYNVFVERIKEDWIFWQFSDKGTIKGIPTRVDLNVFQGNRAELKKYVVQ